MYEGRIVGSFDAETADIHEIGLLMTGGPASRRADVPVTPRRRDRRPCVTLRLEPRLTVPRWLSPVATILALVVALVISGLVIAFVGGDPIRSYGHIVSAAFGSVGVISDTLVKATPLHPHRPRLHARVPDAALEHRRRGPAAARGVGRERRRPGPAAPGRHPRLRADPGR